MALEGCYALTVTIIVNWRCYFTVQMCVRNAQLCAYSLINKDICREKVCLYETCFEECLCVCSSV